MVAVLSCSKHSLAVWFATAALLFGCGVEASAEVVHALVAL